MFAPETRPLKDEEFEGQTEIGAAARPADPDAFQMVFRRYSKPVLVFIHSLLGDRERAEELTQETFIRAYHRLHTFRGKGRFSTWLFGIARNVVREAIKKKYRNLRKATSYELSACGLRDTRIGPDERVLAEELQRMIQTALMNLPEDQRIVFILKVVSRMRYEEISEVTGASVGKLKTDLHRARLKMRKDLQPYIEGEFS